MSRLTSHQLVDLMEAYNAVHAPQINEEQVWEEVESWVNSLLEEGYDLSEYTWEEMYEEYITEIGVNFGGQKAVDAVKTRSAQQQQSNAKLDAARTQRFGGTRPSGATSRSQLAGGTPAAAKPTSAAPAKYKSSSDGKTYANYNDALAAKNSRTSALGMQQGLQRTFKAGGGNAAVAQGKNPLSVMAQGSTNLQRQQRPATPAPTAARPATPAPTAAPARNGFGAPTAPMAARSSVSSVTAPTPTATPAPAPTATPVVAKPVPKPAAPGAGRDYLMKRQLNQNFDVFDVIKGHLIDEGYADTEEAALQIMANMSEEWRESIVEYSDLNGFKPSAFPNMKQYPAVLNGNQGMVSGQPGSSGRGFRKDPKDYKAAVSTIEKNTGRKIK